MQMIFK